MQRDPDLLLIERMLAPPPLEDARSSLQYWQRRRKRLPLYRRAARREAKEMAGRWERRVDAAEQLAFEARTVGRLLSSPWLRRVRAAKGAMVWLGWIVVTRKLRLVARGFAAVGLLLVVAVLLLFVLVVGQLA